MFLWLEHDLSGEIHFPMRLLLVSLDLCSPEATDLLQKLALDTTADAGDVLTTKEKVSFHASFSDH